MEEHLRSLAASLGECSRIVSQVLESSNSGSSANVSNEATQVLLAHSGRSASLFQPPREMREGECEGTKKSGEWGREKEGKKRSL